MSGDPRFAEVELRLRGPASVDDVRAVLPILDELAAGEGTTEAVADGFRSAVIVLRELTESEPNLAAKILVNDLLSRCLVPDHSGEDDYGWFLGYGFGEWVDDLPEAERHEVRSAALRQAITALDGPPVRNALRLIAAIGYWDQAVLGALDRLAHDRDDVVGDQALSTRVSLRQPLDPSERSQCLSKLHARIPAGPNRYQCTAGRIIGTHETAQLVWECWLAKPERSDPESELLNMFARSLLSEIAERAGDQSLTTRVWGWLVDLSGRPVDGLEPVFSMNSSLVNRLDVPDAVPQLIRLATAARRRDLYLLRALECRRPAHMPGWDLVATSDIDVVRKEALQPTRMTGLVATSDLHDKEAAWDVLLCHGAAAALPSFRDAIAEESGYVAHRFLQLAACLGMAPLPSPVDQLLAGSAGASWGKNERLVAQIGAIEAAHGAGTPEAFAALLGYRPVGDGVLLSAIEALAETALRLLREDDRGPVVKLFTVAQDSPHEDSRATAAGALAGLLEHGALTLAERGQAAALLTRSTTDVHARRQLLYAFAALGPEGVEDGAVRYASGVVTTPAVGDVGGVRAAAVWLVGLQPRSRHDLAFLTTHLGLAEQDGKYVLAGPRPGGRVAPHVVAQYYAADPERFGTAVASLVGDGDEGTIALVLPAVREAANRTPAVVSDALLARLRAADQGYSFEPEVLRALAAVTPDRLLAEGCENVTAWLPQARAELAETLGELVLPSGNSLDARFTVLARLAVDGVYAVRREAYRQAATCEPDRLLAMVTSWAAWRDDDICRAGPRRYAAECAGWLTPEAVSGRIAGLAWDPEPAVRDAFERSVREREERRAAEAFEREVLGVSKAGSVIRHWRHGLALGRVGDDRTVRRLAGRRRQELPPAVRYWLKRVQKAVADRWAGVTRKWPEPWYARPGRLERFSGEIRGTDGRDVYVEGTLWLLASETPNALSSWGGWGTCERSLDLGSELRIPGRRPAKVLVLSTHFPSEEIVFSGSSAYPSEAGGAN
ncbi:hypothetical protein [Limnoglobus roseus]|uniref:Uncharacterized protein n=1 Tax=Limnoglobus roseus TaxID=2598579 RepID=A0A5C1AG48_9BACT|nr:hypothetical protein [Limnoglobus roseus]QEL17605.1 hypothetical protein PX52LOC_04601 [Limnoglobus roseus]